MGGTGSLGEIAIGPYNTVAACLVDDLFATCKQISSSLPRSEVDE